MTEPFIVVTHCHCECCKRIAGGYGTVSGRAPTEAIRVLAGRGTPPLVHAGGGLGEDVLLVCGSNLFGGGWPESEIASVRLSAFGLDYDRKPEAHTFVRSVAAWEILPDDGLPRYEIARHLSMAQRIFPMIAYEDTAAAIDWLVEAFGFTERGERYVMEDGTIGHAELELDGEIVMLATPNREYQSPKTHREDCEAASSLARQPVGVDGVLVVVDDLDAHHARRSPPARRIRAPEEGPDGRLYTAEDLEGHRWMFQQA